MAGLLPSFNSGSNLALYIGNVQVAYGSNISFVDDVSHASVGGIGSYSYDALEPTQYIARGSFSLVRYSTPAAAAIQAKTVAPAGKMPTKAHQSPNTSNDATDGNSMLHPSQFNPVNLLLSKTFDIKIFERTGTGSSSELSPKPAFILQDCRMTGYSIGFTPGSVVSENISFMCILIKDVVAQGG